MAISVFKRSQRKWHMCDAVRGISQNPKIAEEHVDILAICHRTRPSPVTDGENVYVFFGDFGVLAYSTDGVTHVPLALGPFKNANGHGSSPILYKDLLILVCDQDTDSYLLAVDKKTGVVRWKTP